MFQLSKSSACMMSGAFLKFRFVWVTHIFSFGIPIWFAFCNPSSMSHNGLKTSGD